MATDKTKLQAYLDDLIGERFKEWKEERLFKSDSAALNQLLAEYFGLGTSSALLTAPKPQELKELVAEEVNHALIHLREEVEKQGKALDELWTERAERNNNRWLDEASLRIIRERLDKLEEMSKSPADSPFDSSAPQKKSRAELAQLFGVSSEAVRKWELSGELERRGWMPAPDSLKSPKQYIPVN